MDKEDKFILISVILCIVIISLIGFVAYRVYLTIYVYNGYITDHNYYLDDNNTNSEKVIKYLRKYLYKKYNKEFIIETDNKIKDKEKLDFCGPTFGCAGVGKVDDIYVYHFIAKDDRGFSYSIDYTNGYKYKKEKHERKVDEKYNRILIISNIVSKECELYNIQDQMEENYDNSLSIYLYDEDLNTDVIKRIIYRKYYNYKIYITNDEETYNNFNNKTINDVHELKYGYLYDEKEKEVKDLDLFNAIKKDDYYFITVNDKRPEIDIQIGKKEKE